MPVTDETQLHINNIEQHSSLIPLEYDQDQELRRLLNVLNGQVQGGFEIIDKSRYPAIGGEIANSGWHIGSITYPEVVTETYGGGNTINMHIEGRKFGRKRNTDITATRDPNTGGYVAEMQISGRGGRVEKKVRIESAHNGLYALSSTEVETRRQMKNDIDAMERYLAWANEILCSTSTGQKRNPLATCLRFAENVRSLERIPFRVIVPPAIEEALVFHYAITDGNTPLLQSMGMPTSKIRDAEEAKGKETGNRHLYNREFGISTVPRGIYDELHVYVGTDMSIMVDLQDRYGVNALYEGVAGRFHTHPTEPERVLDEISKTDTGRVVAQVISKVCQPSMSDVLGMTDKIFKPGFAEYIASNDFVFLLVRSELTQGDAAIPLEIYFQSEEHLYERSTMQGLIDRADSGEAISRKIIEKTLLDFVAEECKKHNILFFAGKWDKTNPKQTVLLDRYA